MILLYSYISYKNINGMIGFEGSIKDFALTCGNGLTVFGTNATATDLPAQTQEWKYTSGYVIRRNASGNTLTIVLHGFLTNRIATLSHSDGQWTEWDIQTRNSDLKPQIKSYSTNYGLNVRKIKTLTNLNIEISGRPNTSINSEWVALCNVEETTLSTINYVFFTADNGVRYLCYVDNKGDLYFKPSSNILATDFIYCTMTYII